MLIVIGSTSRQSLMAAAILATVFVTLLVGFGIAWWREPSMLEHLSALTDSVIEYREASRGSDVGTRHRPARRESVRTGSCEQWIVRARAFLSRSSIVECRGISRLERHIQTWVCVRGLRDLAAISKQRRAPGQAIGSRLH